jgi:hypothetical protein
MDLQAHGLLFDGHLVVTCGDATALVRVSKAEGGSLLHIKLVDPHARLMTTLGLQLFQGSD